jgi:exonuclease III
MILLARIYRFAIRAMLNAGMADCFREVHPTADGFTCSPPVPMAQMTTSLRMPP